MNPAPFRKLGERRLHRGHVIEVVEASFEGPDGEVFTRDVLHHPGAVAVLPLHADGTVTVVRQYRAPVDTSLLEIPAGLRDVPGEPPAVTAGRELAEEVGLVAEIIRPLVAFHNAAGHSDEVVQVFVATELSSVQDRRVGPEEQAMQVERVALEDLVAMVRDGRVTDAKTIIAVLLVAAGG